MKRSMKIAIAMSACGVAAVLAGCSGGASVDPAALEAQSWQLSETSITDGDLVAANITIAFDGTNAAGFSGVNSYSGPYEAKDDGSITMGPFASTLMAGPDDLMQAESAFMGALEGVTAYEVDAEQLTLTTEDGATLVFSPAQPAELSGTSWNVTNYNNGKEAVVGLEPDSELTIEFGADGTISGSGGVNRFTGIYEYTPDGSITIGTLGQTKMAGPDNLMAQEAAFVAVLQSATAWSVTNNTLDLRDASDALQVSAVAP